MGQGRNAVALAQAGWAVTGVDVSGEAVAAAGRNADKAGVKITGVKSDYASFDLGRDAWDLVVMVFAWAPVDEPAFVERIRASLKPGGLVVFENFVSTARAALRAHGPGPAARGHPAGLRRLRDRRLRGADRYGRLGRPGLELGPDGG